MLSNTAINSVAPVRKRKRAVNVNAEMTAEQRQEVLKSHMRQWHTHNRIMNDAKKIADTAKAEVEKIMVEMGLSDFSAFDAEKGITIEAKFFDKEREIIDIEALFAKVPQETFLKIVSATKLAVNSALGSNMVNAVCKTVKDGLAFKISVKK